MTHSIRLLISSFLIAFALASPAAAGPDEDAEAALAADQKGDYVTAMKLYQSAAAGGVPYAMYNIGIMYFDGKGVDRSYINAMKWYRQAADKSYPHALHALGTMYEKGQGVKRDMAEAVKWFTLAADQGFLAAQNSVGVIYTTGDTGVPLNLVQAHFWFSLAAKEDSSAGSRRDRLKAKMTPAQLQESDKLVKAWKPKYPKK